MKIVFDPQESSMEEIQFSTGARNVLLKRGAVSVELPDSICEELIKFSPEKFRAATAEETAVPTAQ